MELALALTWLRTNPEFLPLGVLVLLVALITWKLSKFFNKALADSKRVQDALAEHIKKCAEENKSIRQNIQEAERHREVADEKIHKRIDQMGKDFRDQMDRNTDKLDRNIDRVISAMRDK